jgi:hypothetical protein
MITNLKQNITIGGIPSTLIIVVHLVQANKLQMVQLVERPLSTSLFSQTSSVEKTLKYFFTSRGTPAYENQKK